LLEWELAGAAGPESDGELPSTVVESVRSSYVGIDLHEHHVQAARDRVSPWRRVDSGIGPQRFLRIRPTPGLPGLASGARRRYAVRRRIPPAAASKRLKRIVTPCSRVVRRESRSGIAVFAGRPDWPVRVEEFAGARFTPPRRDGRQRSVKA
jgi:hypothetical protein